METNLHVTQYSLEIVQVPVLENYGVVTVEDKNVPIFVDWFRLKFEILYVLLVS